MNRVIADYVSEDTRLMGIAAAGFRDAQKLRKASEQRGDAAMADGMLAVEKRQEAALGRLMRQHELWPWLDGLVGLQGALTARVLAELKTPWRFPGQQCSMGHTTVPIYQPGTSCPARPPRADDDEDGCPGFMLAPRSGTGVRSVWKYAGLHVVDGRAPRRRKGVQSDWRTSLKTLLLQPNGVADQIVLWRTPRYRDIYDEKKAGKLAEGRTLGDAHEVARKVAAKAFVGDLLVEWKRVTVPPAPLVGVAEEAEDWLRALA